MVTVLEAPAGAESKVYSKFSAPERRPVEPVGQFFIDHARRTLRGHTWTEYEKIQAEKNVKNVEEENADDDDEFTDDEDEEMLTRSPRDWKSQDHYHVLGLSKYRYRATEDQIRRAHRRKVLMHHPDKKGEKGGLDEDGFFKLIQKAYEILMDPVKRRQYDSVDEGADVEPPAPKQKGDFFKNWTPFFEAEARFSKKQPVPSLGDMNTPKAEVDAFYTFWYNFDSWRSFEYLDEDVPDDTSNRDNKRYIEKKNKAARQKRKTEDNARLRELVDQALSEDPRIKLFKQKEKEEKERRKWEKEAGARKAKEEAERKKQEEERLKKEQEEAAKASKENAKKTKEALKNARKKNKRAIRGSVKEVNYFAPEGESASSSDINNISLDVDYIIEKLNDVQLESVASKVNVKDAEAVKAGFNEIVSELESSGQLSKSALKYFN